MAGSPEDLKRNATNALAGIAGGLFGQAAKPGIDAAGQAANQAVGAAGNFLADRAVAAARAVAIGQLPDKLDLTKSTKMEIYVEQAVNALGGKVKVDGKPDPQTLSEVNKILVAQGRPELAALSDFAKDDLKALNDALGDAKGPKGEPNVQAQNVLRTCGDMANAAKPDFPKPEKKGPAQAPADPAFNGG